MPPQLWHLHTLTRLTEESHRSERLTSTVGPLEKGPNKAAITFHALCLP